MAPRAFSFSAIANRRRKVKQYDAVAAIISGFWV